MDGMTKFDYSKEISEERRAGNLDKAISVAIKARDKFPDENIFEKFLGDLYFQNTDFDLAGESYINFLTKIGKEVEYVKHFANFLQRYTASVKEEDLKRYISKIQDKLKNQKFEPIVLIKLCNIISPYLNVAEMELFQDDRYFNDVARFIRKIENTYLIYVVHCKILQIEHSEKNRRIDKYIVSSMEKREQYEEALQLITEVLRNDTDQVAVRTFFRICRKLNDYTGVEEYIKTHQEIKKDGSFNVLYELVFYYSKIGDISGRDESLRKIEKCGATSIPIMRTLYNFYLQFGMLDKAAETHSKIAVMQNSTRNEKKVDERGKQEEETALALINTFGELIEELEHSRKLISMSELLKGFSHELGQPITNIRYSIQLYRIEMKMGVDTREELDNLLDDILSQTLRINKLLSRFSPIVTEKNEITAFEVLTQINNVFSEFNSRFAKENIEWSIEAETNFTLYGDSIKFDQIFYNLIGNSIYAIKEKGVQGQIKVKIIEKEKSYRIIFQDNGIGIPTEHMNKIFEPFFTTKEREKDENGNGGGEGLGLYIIWNIVRMFDGKIKVDKGMKDGARFIIDIPQKERNIENE